MAVECKLLKCKDGDENMSIEIYHDGIIFILSDDSQFEIDKESSIQLSDSIRELIEY